MPVIDHYALAETEGLEEEMEADLVSFKGSAEHWWIHQALGLPTKWWVLHSSNIAVFWEICELIKANNKASSSCRPKHPDCLVLLQVRHKLLFTQNSTNQMNLALTGSLDNNTGTLE